MGIVQKYELKTKLDILEFFTYRFYIDEGFVSLNWRRFKRELEEMVETRDTSILNNRLRNSPAIDLFSLGYKHKVLNEKLKTQ